MGSDIIGTVNHVCHICKEPKECIIIKRVDGYYKVCKGCEEEFRRRFNCPSMISK